MATPGGSGSIKGIPMQKYFVLMPRDDKRPPSEPPKPKRFSGPLEGRKLGNTPHTHRSIPVKKIYDLNKGGVIAPISGDGESGFKPLSSSDSRRDTPGPVQVESSAPSVVMVSVDDLMQHVLGDAPAKGASVDDHGSGQREAATGSLRTTVLETRRNDEARKKSWFQKMVDRLFRKKGQEPEPESETWRLDFVGKTAFNQHVFFKLNGKRSEVDA